MLIRPDRASLEPLVRAALLEDAPWGDLTSQACIPVDARIAARLVAREDGVLCGEDIFSLAMRLTGEMTTHFAVHDGDAFGEGDVLAEVDGPARAVLQAERVALNFVQRLAGITTMTARYVAAVAGTKTRIVDTRKTTPGLRLVERYAVRCGGGQNHRFSLSDAVMVKDNHLAVLHKHGGATVSEALWAIRLRVPHTTHVEVEVDRLDQIDEVLEGGPDTILLDNFSLDDLREAVRRIGGRALTEASGGVTLATVTEIARTGVDVISVGALTHSVRALDLGLDVRGA
jgi:nicotinate-nucleotide pyrophosphorylase (carboxylating)